MVGVEVLVDVIGELGGKVLVGVFVGIRVLRGVGVGEFVMVAVGVDVAVLVGVFDGRDVAEGFGV